MSDLPELNLFEEIAEIHGLTNSSDFYAYTEDQRFAEDEFNKTWSNYEDETVMDTKEHSSWSSPVRSIPTPTSSGKSSPTRDAWDPMLWHTRSMEEVELRSLSELGHVSPPMSSMVMTTLPTCPYLEVSQAQTTSHLVTKGQDQTRRGGRQSRENGSLEGRGRPGESRQRRKAR